MKKYSSLVNNCKFFYTNRQIRHKKKLYKYSVVVYKGIVFVAAGIEALAILTPTIAAQTIFSARRLDKARKNAEDKPIYSVMNCDIAAAQILKGVRTAKSVAEVSGKDVKAFAGASNAIKELSNTHKAFGTLCKFIDITADHVNPVICLTSGIKVLSSDDKLDELTRETYALGAMFGAEALAKHVMGMPKAHKDKVTGEWVNEKVQGAYKDYKFVNDKVTAFQKFCKETVIGKKGMTPLKHLPGILKGLAFVSASIMGYKAGDAIATRLLGERPVKESGDNSKK